MVHQGTRSMSDHVPVSIKLVLDIQRETISRGRPRSYFKMNIKLMNSPGVLQKAKIAWETHPSWVKDERKKWAMGLGLIRQVLMEEKKRWEREDPDLATLQEKLLQAKEAQENIKVLQTETGELLTDEAEILQEVYNNYKLLYTADQEDGAVKGRRREMLQLIDRRLTREQNSCLRELPDDSLIEELIFAMPKEKAPGLDGVIVEIVVVGWDFMKTDCCRMIRKVWGCKKLLRVPRKPRAKKTSSGGSTPEDETSPATKKSAKRKFNLDPPRSRTPSPEALEHYEPHRKGKKKVDEGAAADMDRIGKRKVNEKTSTVPAKKNKRSDDSDEDSNKSNHAKGEAVNNHDDEKGAETHEPTAALTALGSTKRGAKKPRQGSARKPAPPQNPWIILPSPVKASIKPKEMVKGDIINTFMEETFSQLPPLLVPKSGKNRRYETWVS
ncbi:hypothetical protein R1sor_005779 [Riccia sorocarpa]|uniref:Uncharacterized protein n=1 Tax=Riccia sorocarpa TaxID=122646 RepID=A0ABD3HL70_9MARC